jgi:parallel beta-helix repeat protein
MSKKFAALSFTVALALAGVVALLWLLSGSRVALAQSGTGIIRVATTGSDTPGCGSQATPCQTVQYAVDQAQTGEEIRVASGTYTGVQGRAAPAGYNGPTVITQVVYISKTVTIRGGYTTAFTDPPDPETNQTTLAAQGDGRVLFITGDISPTIEGLCITSGDAAGLSGDPWWNDVGGGVYVISATATISNNRVYSNTVAVAGGGLYLLYSDATLSGNTVISNTADYGGGLFLCSSAATATVSNNHVYNNTAAVAGGGLHLLHSDATLSGNTVISNTADSDGGGLYLEFSDATLSGNTVTANIADSDGGGLYLDHRAAILSGNTVISNSASWDGGGLFLNYSTATLSGNTVISNTTDYRGGGLYLNHGVATLSGNTVISNTADYRGGGLYLDHGADTLINNVIADNQANANGSGLYMWGSLPRLLHTTIARNSGGDGSGVYVTVDFYGNYSTVALTNTILVSHSVGITVTGGNTATLESTLWHGNTTPWSGNVIHNNDYTGAPRFDTDGYHLLDGSEAIDKGVNADVDTDIDGDSRPQGSAPDLGADEFMSALGHEVYLPIILKNR